MKKHVFKRCLSLVIAVLMLTCNMPFVSLAAEGDGITISSNVTAQDIEIDADIEFTYYVEIDNIPYNGEVTGSDYKTYKIQNGMLTMPYNVSAVITDIPAGATYSIKRLEYDNDKYALIEETDAETGDMSAFEYYMTIDGEREKIDADTFNKETDNGNNLTATKYKYTDADGNKHYYDASQVDSLTDTYEVVKKTVPSTTYTFEQKDYFYLKDSLQEYNLSFELKNSGYNSSKSWGVTTYKYEGSLKIDIEGYDGELQGDSTDSISGSSTSIGGSKDKAKEDFISKAATSLGRLSYRFLNETVNQETHLTTAIQGNVTDKLPESNTLSDSEQTFDPIQATAYGFKMVTEHTAVFEAVEVSVAKNLVFDAVFAPAPTGTFSVDFIIYSGKYPESYEDAAFEIRDVNGNVLVEGKDYQLNISSDSVDLKLAEIGYTQYVFSGLKHGLYTIQQSKGADGYIVDSTIYPFEVQRKGGAVVGDNFAKSSFKSQYTALTNNTYNFIQSFRVFKNNSFTLKFTKVDQNNEVVEGAQFMLIERDALLELVMTLARESAGNLDFQQIIQQLQGTDWSNLDVGTIIGIILNIVNLNPDTLSQITIPAILTATSDKNGIVSLNNSSNILNVVGALAGSGISGEQLAEVLKSVFGSMIPEQYLPLLDTLAGLAGSINVNTGMRSGAYVMIETQAPAGYERNSLVYTFVINADGTANVTAGVLFPVIVDAINSRFGINLKDILISAEEFERYKDTIGGAFATFDEYAGAVIDNVVNFLGEILGEENATAETLNAIKNQIHGYYEQYGDLADAIGKTIHDINSMITDQVTEDWHYYNTRYFVDVAINITDCNGNEIDGATYTVVDSDGNEIEVTSNTVTVPFGDYTIKDVDVPDGYLLIEDSTITKVTVDDPAGVYSFDLSYHRAGDPVITTVDSSCETEGTKTTRTYCEVCGELLSEETETIAPKGHSFGEWETVESSTCTSNGIEKHTCSVCGLTETKDLELAAHDWQDEYTTDKNPTCTADGSKSIHCKNCDATTSSTVIPATGHTPKTVAGEEPTCTETGLTEGSRCSVCDTVLEAQRTIAAKGHEKAIDNAVAPTCTETGLTEGSHCSVCNTVLVEQEEVPATGHKPATDKAVEPTCTETGLTEGSHCSVCKTVLVKQDEVPANGHKPVTDKAVDPACTETGLTEGSHCSVCKAVLVEQEEVTAKGHAYGEPAFTWSKDLKTAHALFVCENDNSHNKEFKATVNSAVKTPATCTKDGTTTYTATVSFDGKEYTDTKDVVDIQATGHSYTDYHYNNDATYWEDGTETAECDNGCGTKDTQTAEGTKLIDNDPPTVVITVNNSKWYEFLNSITFGLFFNESQIVTIEAEDSGSGVDKIFYYLSDTEVSADDIENISDGTEYDGSFRINPDNKYIIYVKVIDKLGNTAYYSSDGIVLDATAPEFYGPDAPKDGDVYCVSKSIGVTDENFDRVEVDGVKVDVNHPDNAYYFTVNEPGNHTIVVYDKAGNTLTVNITINGQHMFGDWQEIQAPTCVQRGRWERTCQYCDETEIKLSTDDEFDLHHIWGEPTITRPTCTEKGFTTHTCTVCGYTYKDSYTDALGHSFTDYVFDGNATCTADGTKTAKCEHCDETDTIAVEGSMLSHTYENGVCTICGEKDTDVKESAPETTEPTDSDDEPTSTTDDKNTPAKSPATGNSHYTAAIAGLIACAAAGLVVITKKREED
ncbi:MAG: hypothetical protein J1E81_03185 [Eubacterium sp.]|nr:hypothetical protein [Eubacterium sp.]